MPEVTLIGGPGDGQRINMAVVRPAEFAVPSTHPGRFYGIVYYPERLAVDWPVPGWELRLGDEMFWRGQEHARPLWTTRVWMEASRKAALERHFEHVNAALEAMWRVRNFFAGDGEAHEHVEARVRRAIDELVRLTTPGYVDPLEVEATRMFGGAA